MAKKSINLGRVRGIAPQNAHSDSTTEPYSANQTNNEIIDSFKYNFRQILKPSKLKVLNHPLYSTTLSNGKLTLSLNGTINTAAYYVLFDYFDLNSSHKYYFNLNVDKSSFIGQWGIHCRFKLNDVQTNIYKSDGIVSDVNLFEFVNNSFNIGSSGSISYSPILIDLTEMFGAGNEPTSVEEVQQYLVPNKYYPYGKNIEPSMYVAKGEVNKNMMGVPDWNNTLEIARNVQYNRWTNNTGKNGYYNVVLRGTSNSINDVTFQIKINNNIYSGVPINGFLGSNSLEWSCTIPIGINDNIELYKYSGASLDVQSSIIKFIYAKEI